MSFLQRISQTNVNPYFFRMQFGDGEHGYVYLLCKASLQKELYLSIRQHIIPPYAVVIALGKGEPDERTRFHMERFYGFVNEEQPEVA